MTRALWAPWSIRTPRTPRTGRSTRALWTEGKDGEVRRDPYLSCVPSPTPPRGVWDGCTGRRGRSQGPTRRRVSPVRPTCVRPWLTTRVSSVPVSPRSSPEWSLTGFSGVHETKSYQVLVSLHRNGESAPGVPRPVRAGCTSVLDSVLHRLDPSLRLHRCQCGGPTGVETRAVGSAGAVGFAKVRTSGRPVTV